MSDLVKRLREENEYGDPPMIMGEAADEIERLQSQLDKLTVERDFWHGATAEALKQKKVLADRLSTSLEHNRKDDIEIEHLHNEIENLTLRLGTIREALHKYRTQYPLLKTWQGLCLALALVCCWILFGYVAGL